jgi:predicted NBD/HSP70 family sugar kinase
VEIRRYEPGLRSESIRRANLSAIARELHDAGPLSRSELGARTGLTRSTIRVLIGEFAAAGLASELAPGGAGTPGRPSVVVTPNAARPTALALEINVDSIAAAVVGFGGVIREVERIERPRGKLSFEETVADLAALARGLDGFHARNGDLAGIGVAVAGIVRHADGFVSLAPNLGWQNVALGQAIQLALGGFGPVSVANDADLGALGEFRRGAARGCANLVFIAGEVGVGGGVIVDGRPLAGAAGYGGEFGHMPLNPAGRACHCGSVGCWETEIGEDALLVRAGHPRGGGLGEIEALLVEARAGRAQTLEAIDELGRWLGIGLAGLVNIFNPERIVVGGRFAKLFPFLADTIDSQLDRYALGAPRELVTVAPAALGENAPLIGAAELAFTPFLVDPAAWMRTGDRFQPTLASA